MGRRKRVAEIFRETILTWFRVWLSDRFDFFEKPERLGIPRGHEVGLDLKGYRAAQYMAIFSDDIQIFSLRELAEMASTTEGMMKRWRRTPVFMNAAKQAAASFADFFGAEAVKDPNYYKGKIMFESLAMLPGFDIAGNRLLEELHNIINAITKTPGDKGLYDALYWRMQAFRDAFTFVRNRKSDTEKIKLEDKINDIVRPLCDEISSFVSIAFEEGFLTEDEAKNLRNMEVSILFATQESRIVL
jgi:hypothetical protein